MDSAPTLEQIGILVALIAITTVVMIGSLYLLLRTMARRDDLSELVREAILTSEGYRVVERRRWNFTEQFFKERTQ